MYFKARSRGWAHNRRGIIIPSFSSLLRHRRGEDATRQGPRKASLMFGEKYASMCWNILETAPRLILKMCFWRIVRSDELCCWLPDTWGTALENNVVDSDPFRSKYSRWDKALELQMGKYTQACVRVCVQTNAITFSVRKKKKKNEPGVDFRHCFNTVMEKRGKDPIKCQVLLHASKKKKKKEMLLVTVTVGTDWVLTALSAGEMFSSPA